MMPLFCLLVGGGGHQHAIAPSSVLLPQCHLSVFLIISLQYLLTARPRSNVLFLAFSLDHRELQHDPSA